MRIKFSVIIIAYNNSVELQLTLNSINYLVYPQDDFEVIVVDDGSLPLLEASLTGEFNYNVRFHYIPRTNSSCRSKARNYGASLAAHDALVFIDGDQYLSKDLLSIYNEYLLSYPSTQILLGTRVDLSQWQSRLLIETNSLSGLEKVIRQKKDVRVRINEACDKVLMRMPGAWTFFWSHNFVIKKKLFYAVGGFDENFISWGFEDVELGYRLIQNNHLLAMIENNVFNLHQENRFTEEKHYGWVKNLEYFYQKYRDISIMHQLSFYESFNVVEGSSDTEFISVLNEFLRFSGKVGFINKMNAIYMQALDQDPSTVNAV